MTEAGRQRRPLIVIGLAMAAAITGLLGFAARSQNLYGQVAEIEALDAETGETLWRAEREITGYVRSQDQTSVYLIRDRDAVVALDSTGAVVWKAPDRGAELVIPRGDYVWLSHGPAGTTQLEAEDGEVGWERSGRFAGASTGLAALELSNPQRLVVVSIDSGKKLHKFRHRHLDSFVLGDRNAARLRNGTVWLLNEDGSSREIIKGLPERTWLTALHNGVVVISHRNEDSTGTVLRGHTVATGEEIWRHAEAKGLNSYTRDGFIHLVSEEGARSRDIRTGDEVPSQAYWQSTSTVGAETLVAQLRELVTVDVSTRYLHHARTTYAVEPSSGTVLWTRPGDLPNTVTEGLAAFKDDDQVRVVAASSGEVVATVMKKGRTRVRSGGGRVLVGTGAKIQLIDRTGTKTTITDTKARADAISARYAVFSRDATANTRQRQVFIHDIETGNQIVTEPIPFTFRAWFDGDDLMIGKGSAQLIVDPETGEMEAIGSRSSEYPEPGGFTSVLVALDGDLATMRWSREMGRAHDITLVDGVVLLTSTRPKQLPQEGG